MKKPAQKNPHAGSAGVGMGVQVRCGKRGSCGGRLRQSVNYVTISWGMYSRLPVAAVFTTNGCPGFALE